IYSRVSGIRGAVVAELPLVPPAASFHNAHYMLNSTANWKPLLNGYSGFLPESYGEHLEELGGFPDARAINALKRIGVTHAFVHMDSFSAQDAAAIVRSPALRRIAQEGPVALYEIER